MRRLFTQNPGLKLLALVIAVLLWIIVAGESQEVRMYPVRIDYLVSPDQTLAAEPVGSAVVYIRGSAPSLRTLDPTALTLTLDLRGDAMGEQQHALDPRRHLRGVPPGVSVEGIRPPVLTVRLDRKVRRPVPVIPRVVGAPPEGCRLAGYDIVPSEILIEGPESQLEHLTVVQTAPVDLSGRCQTFTLSVGASPDRPGVRRVSLEPLIVTLRIEPSVPAAPPGIGDSHPP